MQAITVIGFMIPSIMNHLIHALVYIVILYSICSLHVQHNEAYTYVHIHKVLIKQACRIPGPLLHAYA